MDFAFGGAVLIFFEFLITDSRFYWRRRKSAMKILFQSPYTGAMKKYYHNTLSLPRMVGC